LNHRVPNPPTRNRPSLSASGSQKRAAALGESGGHETKAQKYIVGHNDIL
jgi:hypothetical protein